MSVSAGVCLIKEKYVVKRPDSTQNTEDNSSIRKHKLSESENEDVKKSKPNDENGNEKNEKSYSNKEKKRGQNKARPKTFKDDKCNKPCPSIINRTSGNEENTCHYSNCKFIHNPIDYLKSKQDDLGKECHVFNIRGHCPRGITCRFGSSHITAEGYNLIDEEKCKNWKDDTKNTLKPELQIKLQKKKYDLSIAENVVKHLDPRNKKACNSVGAITHEDLITLLPREKKTIDWQNKLYLSPLTTVGNLPFRRICKEYGADITCGEMALSKSILKGFKQEWALVKRHESEDIFGVQICGNNAYTVSKTAQLLKENTEVDFIDLNLGCPIDFIYKNGGGCGMMHRLPALELSVKSASKLLDVPFTTKIRTGVYEDKKIAHTIVPQLVEWGASLITLHGRSREARYTRSADWQYIETCAKLAAPCPLYGNGDILSYEDYIQRKELAPSVHGVMIGRGALIKPWIFTEIKEQKLWDISSTERFDIIKKFTNYGLEHWGSDTQGVENTRRFLLEWLSFLYRYVPVGILERSTQKINERPPFYFGRNDLETLMASNNCADWIKISEMLLGPVPDGFQFLPKHKANSY